MSDYDDIELGGRVLPGVDLTLWLRLVVLLVLAVCAAVLAVTLA